MNGTWYSWGYGKTQASTFVKAWQHIVTLFKGEGADNVTWLWTIQADQSGTGPIESWWPGADYVTWVGIDGYYERPSDTFDSVFRRTIEQVNAFTNKPILLSETAVTPRADQYANIHNLFEGMSQFKTLGLVWFDVKQSGSLTHQDWRIEGDTLAQAAFRVGVAGLTLVSTGRH
jgi:beta-mannanase